jgi:predicted ATP-dependent serine protease
MALAKGKDPFISISNLYDSLGRLIKNRFKNNNEIESIYDENSNIIEVKTNNNLFNLKYSRNSNQNIN